MIERKSDAERIEAHLENLKRASWLGPARQWWPKYAFFFADMPNALKIIEAGKLMCRKDAQMAVDTGSKAVLDITADHWKNFVRLYFRPRTPTQHQVEGFRPSGNWGTLGKHMPVPVFFLFDSKDILTRKTTQFTKGNLSQNPEVGNDAAFFESIPFQKIYHDSWMRDEEKADIKFYRHAEIVVPKELDFEGLERIWCRSEAEYQMLLHLLPATSVKKFKSRIGFGVRSNIHFAKWTFVERVVLEQNRLTFSFNPSCISPNVFAASVEVTDHSNSSRHTWENATFNPSNQLVLNVSGITGRTSYEVRFFLDGILAYANKFSPEEAAF